MARYTQFLLGRLASYVAVVLFGITFIFVIPRLMPVNPVEAMLGRMGIYGLTAYLVTRRTREIGVRIALGAEPGDLIRMVLGEGMRMALTGSALGLLLAAGASRLLTSLLFGVAPLDPLTFGSVIVLFGAIALAASYGPVRRALRINPVEALRYE